MFMDRVTVDRAAHDELIEATRLLDDPPDGLLAALSWEEQDGQVTMVSLWESPGARGDATTERILPLVEAGMLDGRHGDPEPVRAVAVHVLGQPASSDRGIDTGVVAEVPPDHRVEVDGGEGSDALEGGDDLDAADDAVRAPGTPQCPRDARRPYEFASYDGATECTGGPSAGAAALLAWLECNSAPPGRSLGIYNCRTVRGSSTRSLHGEGRALDWGLPLGADGKGTAHGRALVDLLGAHAHLLGVQCVIYDRRIWSRRSPDGRDYGGASPHYDHLHIELSRSSARDLNLATIVDVLGGTATPQLGPDCPKVRRGSRGPYVRALQEALTHRGINPGRIDGVYGPGTESAVRTFQTRTGLHVDGITGRQTWTALAAPTA